MHKINRLTEEPFDGIDPLPKEKKPHIAAIMGLLLGALGVALYFRSLKDFFVCLIVFVALTVIIPGLGAFPGWLFASIYGYFRAETSNKKLREQNSR